MKRQPKRTFSFADRASVVALSGNPSGLGEILSSIPCWLLRAADQRAEQDEARILRTPNAALRPDYFPLPNPWRTLIDAPCVMPAQKRVFRAAQSFLTGLKRLCRVAQGYATLETDWLGELADADARRQEAISRKLAEKFVLSRFIRDETQAKGSPRAIAEAKALYAARKKQLTHRSRWQRKSADFDPILAIGRIKKEFPLETFLVESWQCFPSGPLPGLMFWRNAAITQFWQFHSGQTQFTPDTTKKTRQRLGLLPVSETSPVVWNVQLQRLPNKSIDISGFNRQNEMIFTVQARKHLA